LILLWLFFVACITRQELTSATRSVANTNEAFVLSGFVRAGTTASVRVAYDEAERSATSRRRMSNERLAELKAALSQAQWHRHQQKKIADIQGAMELCDTIDCYWFILTPGQVVDVSRSMECDLGSMEMEALRKLLDE
jgi:hypothetical protein